MMESIGPYRIRRKIGQGGMGIVYEGWDDRLQRAVAVKTIDGSHETNLARERLWREARSLARINHPNVCQVYDVLEESASLVMVLELLEGQSLAERLQQGGVTTQEALEIGKDILRALEALHELGIVHRDLKPSNVFLTRHGAKLLDFGLARSVTAAPAGTPDEAAAAPTMTAPGLIVGTPHYMAPEQAEGRPSGPAADIFSIGAVFYEMLTGKRPFEGASLVDVLHAVLHHNPPPLSGSREIEALDGVIRRAMAKRPEDRYASARAMLATLDSIALSGSSAVSVHTRTVTRLIVLPFRAMKSDEQTDFLTFTLPESISNSLSAMETLIVRSSMVANRFEGPMDPRKVAAEADVDAFLTGSILRAGDRIRLTCQLIQAPMGTVMWSQTAATTMQDLFAMQDELCEQILQSLQMPLDERASRSSQLDVPATAMAYELYLRANQITAIRNPENMRLARDLYLRCIEDSPAYAPAYARLGRTYHFLSKFSQRGHNVEQAEQAFRRAFQLNADLSIAHNWCTPAECDRGQALQAMLRLLKRAQTRRNDPDLFAGLVHACRYCGEPDASLAAHRRGRRLDPNLITSAEHTYFLLGDYTNGLNCYRSAGGAYYLECAMLSAMGDDRTALRLLKERESSVLGTALQSLMHSLRAVLEGDREACLLAVAETDWAQVPDPEILFYMSRHLARIGESESAIKALSSTLDRGFLCTIAIRQDPWFDSLRMTPDFTMLLQRAERESAAVHAEFLAAGGDQVIGPG